VADWQQQVNFFQQLTWRVPGLAPDTILLANEMPIHPTDNSFTAPLNWIYAPGNPGPHLPYLMVYPSIRLGSAVLPALEKGQPVSKDYLVSVFNGSTDRAISVYYVPPACLRFLYLPDGNDPFLPVSSKAMAVLSKPDLVSQESGAGPAELPASIFPPAPQGSWCEYYEKADLARSRGEWGEVGRIAAQAGDLAGQAHVSSELFPFIEGFAHLGNWTQAASLSLAAVQARPDSQGQVCMLWTKIDKALPASQDKTDALKSAGGGG
jgi:hypothetical protein